MELYLIRHAIAEERDKFFLQNLPDSERSLTGVGKKKFNRVAKKLRDIIGPVDIVISSPYRRAGQTAEILKKYYPKTKFIFSEALVPSAAPEDFLRWFNQQKKMFKNSRRIIIVGHEPHLSQLAAWFLNENDPIQIQLKKGGVLALAFAKNIKAGAAELRFLLSPRILGE